MLIKKKYNKLVRDRVPEIISRAGKNFAAHKLLTHDMRVRALLMKLNEESNELWDAVVERQSGVLEELADIYEVLSAFQSICRIDPADVARAMELKNNTRGSFRDGIVLEWAELEVTE